MATRHTDCRIDNTSPRVWQRFITMQQTLLRPLRIALISEHASPLAALGSTSAGGENVYVAQVAKFMARAGHRVDVLMRRSMPYDVVRANFFMSGLVGMTLRNHLHVPLMVTFHALWHGANWVRPTTSSRCCNWVASCRAKAATT